MNRVNPAKVGSTFAGFADQRETSRRLMSPTSSLIPRSKHSSALHDWLYSAIKNLSKSWYRKWYACFYFYFYKQQQFHCPSKINLALLFPWIPTFPINNLYTIVVWLQYLTGRYSWVCHLFTCWKKIAHSSCKSHARVQLLARTTLDDRL